MTSMIHNSEPCLGTSCLPSKSKLYALGLKDVIRWGLDELSEENWKRITQQNGKGEASSDSYHENPLSLMLKDTHLV